MYTAQTRPLIMTKYHLSRSDSRTVKGCHHCSVTQYTICVYEPLYNLVWRASPFTRGRKGLVSCLYATCTAAARSAAQSDRSMSPLRLCGYWYAGRPIRGPPFWFNKRVGLSLPRVLTNQVLDLHEAGDHNNLLKTKSRHLIGQPEYLDSSTILVVTWRDLIGLHSWLQRYKSRIGMTPDPSSLLRRGWPARLYTTIASNAYRPADTGYRVVPY